MFGIILVIRCTPNHWALTWQLGVFVAVRRFCYTVPSLLEVFLTTLRPHNHTPPFWLLSAVLPSRLPGFCLAGRCPPDHLVPSWPLDILLAARISPLCAESLLPFGVLLTTAHLPNCLKPQGYFSDRFR